MAHADGRPVEQLLKALRSDPEFPTDEFKSGPLRQSLDQFEAMAKFERQIDAYFAHKRIDISEKLCYDQKTVTSTLRLFVDSEVADAEAEVAYIKLNVFGRLVLNRKDDLGGDEYFAHYRDSLEFERNFVKSFAFGELVRDLRVDFESPGIEPAKFGSYDKAQHQVDSTNGFSLVRAVKRSEVSFPVKCRISLKFECQQLMFKLSSELARFMKRETATRRQIVDSLFEYARANGLIDGPNVKLDRQLALLFGTLPDSKNSFPVHELSSRVKLLLSEPEAFELDYEVREDAVLKKYVEVYDIKYAVPLESMPEILSFYVSRLVFGEEERKRGQGEEAQANPNQAMRSYEKLTQIQEQIGRKLAAVKAMLVRRDVLKRLAEDPTEYLEDYVGRCEKAQEMQAMAGPGGLGRRPQLEASEFLELLAGKQETLLDREIDSFLKSKQL